jgi:3-methylfumaryl-CoA hydratase
MPEQTSGPMDTWPARALAGLLDLPAAGISPGSLLPPLWHWVYLHEAVAQSGLGPEGHPLHGDAAPPEPGLRRMFAGGRVITRQPLRLGTGAVSRTEEVSRSTRDGRSGRFTMITTRTHITQDGTVAVVDEQDIILRVPGPLRAPEPERPRERDDKQWTVTISETYLFRFSALTYNAHRIHYDVDYCRNQEDYPALVVHGPLQALLMAQLAAGHRPPEGPSVFSYRLVSPLLLGQGLVVGSRAEGPRTATTVRDSSGRLTAKGLWAAGEDAPLLRGGVPDDLPRP